MNQETKRQPIPSVTRKIVYGKYHGHCAYCGCEIEYRQMQVDHKKPLRLGGGNDIDNLLPACRSCNHYKSTLTVEKYRAYLSGIYARLMRDSIPFQVGIRFGIFEHRTDKIVFYFEKYGELDKNEHC